MTSLEYVTLIAPVFAIDVRITALLSAASDEYNEEDFGDQYYKAVALKACHDLAIEKRDAAITGISGSISTIREGDLSISYSNSTTITTGDLNETSYGKRLQKIIKSNIVPVFNRFI